MVYNDIKYFIFLKIELPHQNGFQIQLTVSMIRWGGGSFRGLTKRLGRKIPSKDQINNPKKADTNQSSHNLLKNDRKAGKTKIPAAMKERIRLDDIDVDRILYSIPSKSPSKKSAVIHRNDISSVDILNNDQTQIKSTPLNPSTKDVCLRPISKEASLLKKKVNIILEEENDCSYPEKRSTVLLADPAFLQISPKVINQSPPPIPARAQIRNDKFTS
ncbi:hypothetical protein TRFO_11545 [Tritrichomonas foetus]|uniref:Uncharacterized protein n=1 Tax=Tritrichomonas foetus TaxID=1144522 RepID=A0A1J4J2T0_9EUKA|nr:hypothetical protein TRFO_11545 [Tritrichomonas foetus]|eukprot:OHS93760.1 hypothetical protein TRFO_11545 [Tritrichomonas foetus]